MRILPPGFRFHPTDVELIMYYLKKKIMGKKFQFEAIAELNIYKYAPWDLSDKSLLRRDLEWYFFSPIEKKYGSGARANRATVTGYWKATGKDRPVIYSNRTVGMIKTLIFYKGHAPKGERTNWVMHEYRIEDKNLADIGIIQDSYVLCKIFQKSGMGPKNGAQYGAPFNEDEWNEVESAEPQGDGPLLTVHLQPSSHNNSDAMSPAGATTSGSWPMSKEVQCPARPLAINMPCSTADPSEDVVTWLPMCTDDAVLPIENYTTENANVLFESLHRTAPGPTFGSTLSEEELNDVEETCAKSSPVLSLHVPYRNLNNSAELSLIVPRTSSSWPLSEPGPSTASTSVTKMPSYRDDLPEDDITALLSMFTESSTMLPVEYNNNEHFNTVHTDKSVNAQTCMVKNAIYNGPGDLNNLGELRKSGFDFSNTCGADFTPNKILLDDDMVFLELKDLNTQLEHPAEASESVWAQTDSSYAPYTCYQNLDKSYCGNLQNAVQNVSIFKQTSSPPEGPRWMEDDIIEVSRKGPDIQNLEGYGSDTFMGNGIPFQMSHRQPQRNNIAGQIQRRGKRHRKIILQFSLESMYAELSAAELFAHIITAVKLNDSRSHNGGSSIYFKAEVALKVGECTEDALSHDMGESTCMRFCWGYLPENNIGENFAKCGLKFEIANRIASSMLGKLIIRRATYLIDAVVGSFLCVNCLENIIFFRLRPK